LGWAYYRKGLYGHALSAFGQAVERSPDNPVYRYHLGLAKLRVGANGAGRSELRRALDLRQDFAGADEARRLLGQPAGTRF
jgi:cytochrome c-type biogenesis protein CcmH/NrfG